MGWSRSLALKGREPFPYPKPEVFKAWELTFPHEPNDSLPTNVALNPNTNLPPEPQPPASFAQPWTGKTVPIPVPPPTPPGGGPIP